MGYPHQPHERETLVLSKHFGEAEARSLDGWKQRGGYKALDQALRMEPAQIVDIVKASGLRGRGGAGFPTGVKWSFMKPGDGKPHYLCCNADESEPGTFKDREIMRWTPHALVEGVAVGAYAIGAETAYIYIRGEFTEPLQRMNEAVREAYADGILGREVCQRDDQVDAHHRGRPEGLVDHHGPAQGAGQGHPLARCQRAACRQGRQQPFLLLGLLGLAIFVRFFAFERSLVSGALTMSLLVLPTIIIASREAIKTVPAGRVPLTLST